MTAAARFSLVGKTGAFDSDVGGDFPKAETAKAA
jgi:hypothetical protein